MLNTKKENTNSTDKKLTYPPPNSKQGAVHKLRNPVRGEGLGEALR